LEIIEIKKVSSAAEIEEIRKLFLEYADSLNFPLHFQDFEKEVALLPYEYAAPGGMLLLATVQRDPAGCVAMRKIDDQTCEMKRLYLRNTYRGLGLGKKLVLSLISEAIDLGYLKMRLDTAPSMIQAIALYRSLGFVEIETYRHNPVPGALFMELSLANFVL
jgi:putative acetyltransferase